MGEVSTLIGTLKKEQGFDLEEMEAEVEIPGEETEV